MWLAIIWTSDDPVSDSLMSDWAKKYNSLSFGDMNMCLKEFEI